MEPVAKERTGGTNDLSTASAGDAAVKVHENNTANSIVSVIRKVSVKQCFGNFVVIGEVFVEEDAVLDIHKVHSIELVGGLQSCQKSKRQKLES